MNKKHLSTPIHFLIASAVASLIAVIFRIVLTQTVLDVNGVYERGTAAPTVFHVFLTAAVLTFIVRAYVSSPKRIDEYRTPDSNFLLVMSFLVSFLFIADIIITLYNILKGNTTRSIFDTLELIFAIPSAIYFLAQALKPHAVSAGIAFASLFPTAWCAVYLIRIYFDGELLMTDPGRILEQIAILSAMICFLTESRLQLGKFSHRLFLASASVAPILLLASAVPNLLFSDKLMIGTSYSLARSALCIAFAFFFYSRLLAYAGSKPSDQKSANSESI